MTQDVLARLSAVKEAAYVLPFLSEATRLAVLRTLAAMLEDKTKNILRANVKDLAQMDKADPRYDRLRLDETRIKAIADDVRKVANLPSPIGHVHEDRLLENGLHLQRIAVPLGVIGVIYESRPNVTIDVFALCFKSGNAVALKGGKEAQHSNAVLTDMIARSLAQHNINPDSAYLLPPNRAAAQVMMQAVGVVDVCIPRGSQALIDAVRAEAKVPVIETGAGIVHTYIDRSADIEKAREIILNAKTRRVSVCNALDTVLLHQDCLNDLPHLTAPLAEKSVEIFADAQSYARLEGHYPAALLHHAAPKDFGQEFLAYKMSIGTVASLDAALKHIRKYSSRHSEAIVAEDTATIESFLQSVDAAAVYANASTAFTDGAQFGMGAEIGISTQKLHARGPMALHALTSYKWIIRGAGQIRG